MAFSLTMVRSFLRNHARAYTVRPVTTYAAPLYDPDHGLSSSDVALVNSWNAAHKNWRVVYREGMLVLFSAVYLPKHKKFAISPQGIDYLADFDAMDPDLLYRRYLLVKSVDELAAQINSANPAALSA